MLTAEQQADRLTGLGGSDAAAALGLSPWKTPLELYLEKTGDGLVVPPDPVAAERMEIGQRLEPVIRQLYTDRTGRKVDVPRGTLRHKDHPWMLGHLDGISGTTVLECKAASSSREWGEPGTDQIPPHYILQVQHYLAVADLPACDVAVLFGGARFAVYTLEADPELSGMLIEGEQAFWRRVEARDPPPVDFDGPRARDILRALYAGTDGSEIMASENDEHYLAVYRDARERADRYLDLVHASQAHLLATMKDASTMRFSDGSVMRRRRINRRGYSVAPVSYIDARIQKPKSQETDE